MLEVTRLLLLLLAASMQALVVGQVLPHEPLSVVKSLLSVVDGTSPWSPLATSLNEDAVVELFEELESTMEPISANSIVIAIHKDTVVLDHVPLGIDPMYSVTIPHANALSLISASLPILFDNQNPNDLMIPVQDIFADSDVVIPKSFRSSNLIQLLNTVSKIDKSSPGFLNEVNLQGRVTIQTVNAVIGKEKMLEAWRNSLADLGLQSGNISDTNKITAPLQDFYILLDILLDIVKLAETIPGDIPYRHPDHYSFGWWLNCNLKKVCLTPDLPRDALMSMSPNMRLYVVESLDLAMAVIHTTQLSVNSHSFNRLLEADGKIWSELLRLVSQWENMQQKEMDEESQEKQPDQAKTGGGSEDASESKSQEGETAKEEEEEKIEVHVEEGIEEEEEEGKIKEVKEERLPEQPPSQETPNEKEEEERDSEPKTARSSGDEEANTDTRSDEATLVRYWKQLVAYVRLGLATVWHYFRLYLAFIAKQHWVVRGLLWVLFIIVAHYIVYSCLHGLWFILKTIVPWTQEPRPKLTKQE